MSYVINLLDGSIRKVKCIEAHLLQDYFSVLKEKIPAVCKGHGEEDPSQTIPHHRDCLKWRLKC